MLSKIIEYILKIFDLLFRKPKFDWSINGGVEVSGDVNMVKFEFNQEAVFTANPLDRRGNPAQIETGSAAWDFVGVDADGNDASDEVVITPDPNNELSVTVRSLDTELTGTLSVRADGDPDAGEYFPLVGVVSLVVDGPNAVVFELTNTQPTDV